MHADASTYSLRPYRNLAFAAIGILGACSQDLPRPATQGPDRIAEFQRRIGNGEYAIRLADVGLRASNRSHGFRARFDDRGVIVTPRTGGDAFDLKIRLAGWGRESRMETTWSQPPVLGECAGQAVDERGDCLRQVEYAHPGVTEWWANSRAGLEHGFQVDAEPPGEGPLVFDVEFSGMQSKLVDGGEGVLLTSSRGPRLRYAEISVRDARGTRLPARFEYSPTGVLIAAAVDDAAWPITVDPLLTTADWTAEGNQAGAYFGYSVASAGDVNGDGYGDVIVGARFYDNGENAAGRAFVYLGSSSGLGVSPAWSAENDQGGAYFGSPVASAGDVNGDGYGDVIVGAPGYVGAGTDESFVGRAFVYLGSSSGLSASPAWTAVSDQAGAAFGSSVASAGDVNGDGYGDVIVGASHYDNGEFYEGRAFVYLGSSSGLSDSPAWTAESDQPAAYFGGSVASRPAT